MLRSQTICSLQSGDPGNWWCIICKSEPDNYGCCCTHFQKGLDQKCWREGRKSLSPAQQPESKMKLYFCSTEVQQIWWLLKLQISLIYSEHKYKANLSRNIPRLEIVLNQRSRNPVSQPCWIINYHKVPLPPLILRPLLACRHTFCTTCIFVPYWS